MPAVSCIAAAAALAAAGPVPVDSYVRTLNAVPTAASLAAYHELLGSEPHIAGTPGDQRQIERLRDAFVAMGLLTVVEEFHCVLPEPHAALLEIVTAEGGEAAPAPAESPAPAAAPPTPARRGVIPLAITERNLLEDPASAHPGLTYGWNAFSGNGDITAEVVYANYGTKADFESLRAQGIDVKGKIVLARYGGNFRGYKWKFAQQAGAAGLLIYTDPADTGSTRGKVYPEGGWANDTCVQRGSILAIDYPGDPQTPFEPATADAARTPLEQLGLPAIPVQPIGYGAAAQIMSRMKGQPVKPDSGWKGGMPVEYKLTGGPELQLHLKVEQDRERRTTANVLAWLPGRTWPDQMVIVGCHHDAWGFGAADPLAGTMVLMECARSFAAAAERGERPERTVVFAAWGAEEFGIFGSTEWVEGHRDQLLAGAVAYINLDMAAMGPNFGAASSPSLREAILSACVRVPQARGANGETVYDRISGNGRTEPSFGDLGGGSDHIGFNCHVGVASASLGGSGSEGNSYHSNYDTIAWYRKVVGADYQPALMITRMTNALTGLLAAPAVPPLSAARHGRDAVRVLQDLIGKATDPALKAQLEALSARASKLAERGAQLDAAAASALASLSTQQAHDLTLALVAMDRAWLDQAGLEGRPWFRSLLAASDRDSGYASVMLPLLAEAVATGNAESVKAASVRYQAVFDRLAQAMDAAQRVVKGPPSAAAVPIPATR